MRDLRLAVVAGSRVASSARACATVVEPDDPGADLLLVEPAEPSAAPARDAAARHGVPTAAWLRDPATALAMADDLRAYDGLFVTDPALAGPLARATGARPAPLPEAASREALAATRRPQPEDWIAAAPGAPDDAGFARLLAAAPGIETRELPDDAGVAAGMLTRCAALLATHAEGASQLHVPAAVFDAVAARTPVVVPANRGAALLLPGMVPRAVGPKHALQLVGEALQQGSAPPVGAAAIRNAHTHAHRIASVASALGLRAMPGAAGRVVIVAS